MLTASGFVKKVILLNVFNFIGKIEVLVDAGAAGATLSYDLNAEMRVAIDLSLDLSFVVRKNVEGIIGDLNSIPLSKKCCDCVLILDVLEHMENDSKIIQSLSYIIKERGFLILTTPIKDVEYMPISFMRKILKLDRKTLDSDFGHVRPGYQFKELKDLLESHGFKIIFHQTFGGPLVGVIDLLIYRTLFKLYYRKKPFKSTYIERKKFKRRKAIELLERLHDLVFPFLLGPLIRISEKSSNKMEHFIVCRLEGGEPRNDKPAY